MANVLSPVPTSEEAEAAAGMNGETQVVGGALIAGGVQFGVYRDGKLEPSPDLAQKVDFVTGKVLKATHVEGASMYDPAGKEPVKLAAKKSHRTRVKTDEAIAEANKMSAEEEAAQVAAEEAAAAPAP